MAAPLHGDLCYFKRGLSMIVVIKQRAAQWAALCFIGLFQFNIMQALFCSGKQNRFLELAMWQFRSTNVQPPTTVD